MTSLQNYENLLAPARKRFADCFGVRALKRNADSALCELFLMYFCALGVRMTEPVEGWIRRAASGSARMGLTRLGHDLHSHAAAEANHHLLMKADLRTLTARWNERNSPPINPDALLDQPLSPGVASYCRLHEDNLAGKTPFAQIAIEYEIEMLPLRFGERVLTRCIDLLGTDILSSLSFITQHIALDGAHSELNARMLAELLEDAPWSLPALATAGRLALDAYAGFLGDCVRLAGEHLRQVKNCARAPRPFTRFQVMTPPRMAAPPGAMAQHSAEEKSCPDWLDEVRFLRARVLFDRGRRPAFRTAEGCYSDADPADFHAYHLLAFRDHRLIGCVRIYHLDREGPACATEKILGREAFAAMLRNLKISRCDIVEIGRWIVEPEYRTADIDLGVGIQLAAASAALAREIGRAAGKRNGFAICAAGVGDRQSAMLKRVGMTPAPGGGVVSSAHYQDEVQILCVPQSRRLHPQFLRLIEVMAKELGLDETPAVQAATIDG